MLPSTIMLASTLLFVGGALTALGLERLIWNARSGGVRVKDKKKETIEIDT